MEQPVLSNLFSLGGEQSWRYIGQVADSLGAILGILTIVLMVVGVWQRKQISRYFKRVSFSDVGEPIHDSQQFDAVVFTVSREELPKNVIDKTKPKAISLIATAESKPVAEAIKKYAEERGIEVQEIFEIADKDNPAYSKSAVKRALKLFGNTQLKNIAVDVTGGTTPMSIGAFMAAQQFGATTIFVKADYDQALKRVKQETAKIVCISAG
jgi:ribose 5-phosphate isomerase RpiB